MLSYGFYNSINNDRKYNALHFSSIFEGIITDGVFMTIGDTFIVAPSLGMRISVGTGRAWFDHTWTTNDSPILLTLSPSEIVLPRIDAIVLEVNSALGVRANSIKIVNGTPASEPARPAMTKTEYVHQYPLAYIRVNATVEEIVAGDITKMVGTSECPYVTGILSTVNTEMLDEIEALLASVVENTNELTILYYNADNVMDHSITYWEDDTTKKEEEVLTFTDGQLTSIVTYMYDEAGTLKRTYTDTMQYYADGRLDRVRRVVS